ncbi:transporter substrate-binding domain-containing protein [Pseudodesulfovibrio sp. zrk46]|uniref:substrate-binding periplasmic protein n=1 Tax=Pseudodesulfovibrio sp. zrk46 TaxID=2725288 RepID=UPI001449403E|nr:transporter substrate-binding domain-containing protein [Pseudodesulfovibrio sp. zrk46]QJB56145.1 transporter substrate-binding domain-containing protein [Pseudodesulfovibrio sp. zrk46]
MRIVTLHSPPIAFEQGGKITGFGVDLVREGLRRMGHTATVNIIPWKRAVHMTRFGDADAIFYMVENVERRKWFYFPDEHLVMETTVMLKRAGESFGFSRDRTDYPEVRLGLGLGYYYGPELKEFLDNAEFESIETAPAIETNFFKLLEKRIDVFLSDLALAQYFLKERASGHIVSIVRGPDGEPLVLDSVKSYLAFSKETMSREMADAFADTLKEMKEDGTCERIINKYR